MAQRQRRDPAKERYWRRMVRGWKRSGLNVREYCDFESLAEPTFYAWRRELAKRDREAQSAARRVGGRVAGLSGAAVSPARQGAPTFLPVRVVGENMTEPLGSPPWTDCIEVHLPSGVRLRVPTGCNRQALVEVLAALETRSC
jgi:hypothetical protein